MFIYSEYLKFRYPNGDTYEGEYVNGVIIIY